MSVDPISDMSSPMQSFGISSTDRTPDGAKTQAVSPLAFPPGSIGPNGEVQKGALGPAGLPSDAVTLGGVTTGRHSHASLTAAPVSSPDGGLSNDAISLSNSAVAQADKGVAQAGPARNAPPTNAGSQNQQNMVYRVKHADTSGYQQQVQKVGSASAANTSAKTSAEHLRQTDSAQADALDGSFNEANTERAKIAAELKIMNIKVHVAQSQLDGAKFGTKEYNDLKQNLDYLKAQVADLHRDDAAFAQQQGEVEAQRGGLRSAADQIVLPSPVSDSGTFAEGDSFELAPADGSSGSGITSATLAPDTSPTSYGGYSSPSMPSLGGHGAHAPALATAGKSNDTASLDYATATGYGMY